MTNASQLSYIEQLMDKGCGSLMNQTTPLGCKMIYYLVRTCPFVLLLVGTVGNLLNIAVLSRPHVRSQSTMVYLLFMACSDLTTLWSSLSRSTFAIGWRIDIRNWSKVICVTQEWISLACAFFSLDLVAFLSMERMLLIKFPISARQKMTRKNALKTTVAALVYSFAVMSPIFIGNTLNMVEFNSVKNGTTNSTVFKCYIAPQSYLRVFERSEYLIVVARSILSILIITISNTVIVTALAAQRRRMQTWLTEYMTESQRANLEKNREFTRMTVLLATYATVTALPFTIFTYVTLVNKDLPDEEWSLQEFFRVFFYCAAMSNCALNFLFYFSSGPMFKREIKAVWMGVSSKLRRLRNSHAVEN